MENILKQILEFFGKRVEKEDTFYTADEAFRKILEIKQTNRDEFKKSIIKILKREILFDINSIKKYCIVNTYSSLAEKDVLPEVADYFREKGYDVDLKNGEDYNETNILIISWQNRNLFREEVAE